MVALRKDQEKYYHWLEVHGSRELLFKQPLSIKIVFLKTAS